MASPTFCASVALIVYLFVTSEAVRPTNKAASAFCTYDADEKSLTLVFLADYNGDPVEKVLALHGRVYDRENNNEASCVKTTRGSADKLQITSMIYTDNSQTDVNPCGGRRTNPNSAAEYEWTFELREHHTQKVYLELDRRYQVACKISEANTNYVTTSIKVYGEDKEDDALRVKPDNEMSILELRNGEYQKWQGGGTYGLKVGQHTKIRITSNLHPQYEDFLHYYGSKPFFCERSISASFNPNVGETLLFIKDNSCPADTDPFDLSNGFTKAAVDVKPSGFYNLETEDFVFAPDIPAHKTYHLRCFLAYCYGHYDPDVPANNDPGCEDPCSQSRASRKKRSTAPNDYDQVILTVNIDTRGEENETDGQGTTPEKTTQTTLIAVIAVIGALIFILVIITAILLVARRRQYKDDDVSSQGSTRDLRVKA